MSYVLPAPYGGAALEPREPVTVGACAECGCGFALDELVYRTWYDPADNEPLHERCAVAYLADFGGLRVDTARDLFDVWGGRE